MSGKVRQSKTDALTTEPRHHAFTFYAFSQKYLLCVNNSRCHHHQGIVICKLEGAFFPPVPRVANPPQLHTIQCHFSSDAGNRCRMAMKIGLVLRESRLQYELKANWLNIYIMGIFPFLVGLS